MKREKASVNWVVTEYLCPFLELAALGIDRWRCLLGNFGHVSLTSLSFFSLLVVLEPSRIILVDLQAFAVCVARDALAPRVGLVEKVLLFHAG